MDPQLQTNAAREDLGLLAVMDALVDEQQVTQRELARRTGLNLKKVNYCLHKLLDKGYVKFQRAARSPHKRSYLYILTPSGFQAKSRLAYRFVRLSLSFYNQVSARLGECLRQMAAAGMRRIALYGASDAARIVLEQMEASGLEVAGVVDDGRRGTLFHGVPVISGAELSREQVDAVLITVLDEVEDAEVQLRAAGWDAGRVWRVG